MLKDKWARPVDSELTSPGFYISKEAEYHADLEYPFNMLEFVTDVTEIGLILSCLHIAYDTSSEIVNVRITGPIVSKL